MGYCAAVRSIPATPLVAPGAGGQLRCMCQAGWHYDTYQHPRWSNSDTAADKSEPRYRAAVAVGRGFVCPIPLKDSGASTTHVPPKQYIAGPMTVWFVRM